MRLVILTQYFPPEVGAPQNRLYELAQRLERKGVEVTVLTAMPNYPSMKIHPEYRGKFFVKENVDNLTILRSWIYATPSKGVMRRLLNYYSFVFSAFWIGLFKLPKHDFLLVESPPLFLGKTAFLLSKIYKSKLIFNVSDLWPESAEKLNIVTNKTFLKLATVLEEFMYKKSTLITGQTQGICENISARFPKKDVYWLPNGVDLNYYDSNNLTSNFRESMNFQADDFLLLYAGIIGHAQGLEVILKSAAILKTQQKIKFILLGSGPEKEKLLALKKEHQLDNVIFLDPVDKTKMPNIVAGIDVAVIPLKKLDLFKGAIPSKIFENLAMKKPIILGVEGEAKHLFIDQGKAGLAFEPENENALAAAVLSLFNDRSQCQQMGENGLKFVSEHFTRDLIANRLYDKLKSTHD